MEHDKLLKKITELEEKIKIQDEKVNFLCEFTSEVRKNLSILINLHTTNDEKQ